MLVDHLPVGVLAYRHGWSVFANRALLDYVGLVAADVVGRRVVEIIDQLFAETERDAGRTRLRQAAAGGVLPPVERRLKRADGTFGVAELTTLTVEVDGEPTQLTIVRDLTEARHLEGQVAAADRMATLGRVAAGLAHELNNPLAHLIGSLDLARERLPAARQVLERARAWHTDATEAALAGQSVLAGVDQTLVEIAAHLGALHGVLNEAAEGARRVRAVMDDFRSLSMPTSAVARPIDVRSAVRSALRLSAHQLQHVAQVTENLAAAPTVLADEARLCQALVYLLVDVAAHLAALQFTSADLSVNVYASQSQVFIDIGGPMAGSIDTLARPPEPNQPSQTRAGVHVCAEILRGYGGVLAGWQQGARRGLSARLPAGALRGTAVAAAQPDGAALRGRVCVIDDDMLVAQVLQRLLTPHHDVAVFTDSIRAMEALIGGAGFDVVLCDAMMPGASGLEVYERVAAAAPHMAARFVFITGGAYLEQGDYSLVATGRPCLPKPFDVDNIRTTVRQAVAAVRGAQLSP